jgi:hypothetical protein
MDDQANFVTTEWEEGVRPDWVVAERKYPCGCKATRISTAGGWQWAGVGDCPDETHRQRSKE